jgi:hypothetical protein
VLGVVRVVVVDGATMDVVGAGARVVLVGAGDDAGGASDAERDVELPHPAVTTTAMSATSATKTERRTSVA